MMRFLTVLVACVGMMGAPVTAQQVIAEYGAFIGPQDLTNSNGARLSQPWQVLRQDRANFHRFGVSQPGDDWDPVFSDFDNRGRLEALVRAGHISGAAAQSIMAGNARVYVRVFGNGSVPSRVEVEVWNESAITAEAPAPSTVVPAAPPSDPVPEAVPAVAAEPEL